MRIGTGYDSHRFDRTRELILGGVRIPDAPGLAGISDGDAVAHAIIDALLGAGSLGDIGQYFPQGDRTWWGADSMDLLRRSVDTVHEAGFRVSNVDVTVICQRPTIAPYAEAMRTALSAVLHVEPSQVSVKGKSNEGMGWEGREEGIAVHAAALIKEVP